MNSFLATLLGKTLRGLIRIVRRGGGSALPGLIVSKLFPGYLESSLRSLPEGLVLVTGSAGKSSTTDLLARILIAHGKRVFTNNSTANIKQGLISAVISQSNLAGKLSFDIAVLEVDEGHLRQVLALKPRLAILTNVLSDQLDRFNDPAWVIERLQEVARSVELVVINGDDSNLNQMKFKNAPKVVGLSPQLKKSKTAPQYAFNFAKEVPLEKSAFVHKGESLEVCIGKQKLPTSSSSLQHALNDALAVLAANELVSLNWEKLGTELLEGKRVFARNEIVEIRGKSVNLRLVQNPTSFQLNLDELSGKETPLMLMAGSDIHDPSWLWTVDFSKLKKVDIVGGSNAFDLALRLYFAGVEVKHVEQDPAIAADKFLELSGHSHTVLFSADAMRRTRRHLGLAK